MSGLAYLGPPIDHMRSLEMTLQSLGRDLTIIPDSLTARSGSPQSRLGRKLASARRVFEQFAGTRDPEYLRSVCALIDEKVSTIVAYWGTLPLPDIKAIKRVRPHVKVAVNVLCHPLGLDASKIAKQNMIFRNAVSSLDGIILSNPTMESYFDQHILRGANVRRLVLAPYWDRHYFAEQPLPGPREKPNVVFLGRMDWKSGQPSDNVMDFLYALMNEGVDVYYSSTPEGTLEHKHAISFDALPLSKTATFAAKFDCSLIIYNTGACGRTDRFDVTVPDRLISSVAAGIPIAIPSEGYTGCKQYLQEYGAVMTFRSAADLAGQLRDRRQLSELRTQAQTSSPRYHAQNHYGRMLDFLDGLQA